MGAGGFDVCGVVFPLRSIDDDVTLSEDLEVVKSQHGSPSKTNSSTTLSSFGCEEVLETTSSKSGTKKLNILALKSNFSQETAASDADDEELDTPSVESPVK